MLGYGLVNSQVHKFCVSEIIINFFNRSSIFLSVSDGYFYFREKYYSDFEKSKGIGKNMFDLTKDKTQEGFYQKFIDALFDVFLQEELELSQISTFMNIDGKEEAISFTTPQEPLYYYYLSSLLANNSNYNFDSKNIDQIIKEGEVQLKILFTDLFLLFLNKSKIYNLQENIGDNITLFNNYNKIAAYQKLNDLSDNIIISGLSSYGTQDKKDVFNNLFFLAQRNNYIKILQGQINALRG